MIILYFKFYIFYILGLFRGTRADFLSFVATMKAVDRDIKFTSDIDWEENKAIFLDVTVTIDENGYLQTDLYTKPNAKNSLLLPSSAHKPSVTRSTVYSLALRINQICSKEEEAEKRYEELAEKLREREYSESVISAGIYRAKVVKREVALKKVVKEKGGRQHRLITVYKLQKITFTLYLFNQIHMRLNKIYAYQSLLEPPSDTCSYSIEYL